MRTVKIGQVSLGVKPVKVLVSLEGATVARLCAKAKTLEDKPVDILEWRMDSFGSFECEKLCAAYKTLKEKTKKPILCTLRTSRPNLLSKRSKARCHRYRIREGGY